MVAPSRKYQRELGWVHFGFGATWLSTGRITISLGHAHFTAPGLTLNRLAGYFNAPHSRVRVNWHLG